VTASPPRRARARTAVDPARAAAYAVLMKVAVDDAYLNLALNQVRDEARLVPRDAAFVTELAAGTARMQGLYDAVLDTRVRGGVSTLEPAVLVGLRLGVHQLLSLRVPDHAAVGTSVELVRAAVGERPVRLVNAVLRGVARADLETWIGEVAPPRDDDLLGHLAVRHAHPRWMVEEFARALPDGEGLEVLLAADNAPAAVTLAARPGLMSRSVLETAGATPGRWSPYAASWVGDPGVLPEVRSGRVGVQDEGSQLVAMALAAASFDGRDERWLDLCAGPGGKAAMLTGLALARNAVLLANEPLPHRAKLVASALRAYGGASTVVCGDGVVPALAPGAFDRVLVDAPCSGLGSLRRRPESRWRRTPADLDGLVRLQRGLLSSALDLVRPGGVVAYVTCSPVLAETRGVVDTVLGARAGEVGEDDARATLRGVPALGDGPHFQLWPHLHGTDAMFCALLRRQG